LKIENLKECPFYKLEKYNGLTMNHEDEPTRWRGRKISSAFLFFTPLLLLYKQQASPCGNCGHF